MSKYLALALLTLPALASAQYSYTADFQGTVGPEWSSNSVTNAPNNVNRKYLGEFDNQTVLLTLTGLTPGVSTVLGFDLMVLKSWDGSNATYGPDFFSVLADGNQVLNATFDNTGFQQTYSAGNPLGGPLVASQTSADEADTLGYSFYGDSVYKFGGSTNAAFTFVPATSSVVIAFTGSGLQGVSDESWGLDNVSVTQAVPEPASMAILGVGLAALRRRKRRA